jgi:hypothetical protein
MHNTVIHFDLLDYRRLSSEHLQKGFAEKGVSEKKKIWTSFRF